jgi:hypothetical protein
LISANALEMKGVVTMALDGRELGQGRVGEGEATAQAEEEKRSTHHEASRIEGEGFDWPEKKGGTSQGNRGG